MKIESLIAYKVVKILLLPIIIFSNSRYINEKSLLYKINNLSKPRDGKILPTSNHLKWANQPEWVISTKKSFVQLSTPFLTNFLWINSPSPAATFHLIGELDILAVDVKLPLALPQNSGQHRARVYADAHVHRTVGRLLDILDCLDHRQAHVDAQHRMVRSLLRCSAYAVVTITQNLYTQLFVPETKQIRD